MTQEEAIALYDSGKQATVDVLVAQSERIERLEEQLEKLASDLPDKARRTCRGCIEKRLKIDRLEDEVKSLRRKLKYREKKSKEGYFGSSTPSSKVPVKANSGKGKKKRKSGAKPGHKGHGRKGFTPQEADRLIPVSVENESCACGGTLHSRGNKRRSVLDLPPMKPEKLLYMLARKQCTLCNAIVYGRAPGVLPGWLYGNSLVSQAAAMHYVHGIPMGTIEEMLGLPRCALIDTFHDLAAIFEPVLPLLMQEFRYAAVKHADETLWRTEGQSGYAWVFRSETVTLFLFRHTRSATVPLEVLGKEKLPGVLCIDRYSGYSRVPCKVQYCYEHLKRNLQDIVKQFPDEPEVKRFGRDVVAMLREAIKLRTRRISDKRFYEKAANIKDKIKAAMEVDANHEAIRTYQEIFRESKDKMYHWADDRRVPAHNNTAEKELRPIVIARKISFGSQSPKGRNTREVLASVLNTLRQRGLDPAVALKAALDQLAVEPKSDPYALLFGQAAPLSQTESSTSVQRPTPPDDDSTSKPDSDPPVPPSSSPQSKPIPQFLLVAAFLLITLLLFAVGIAKLPANPLAPFLRQSFPLHPHAATTSPSPSPLPLPSPSPNSDISHSRAPPGQAHTVTAQHRGDPSTVRQAYDR